MVADVETALGACAYPWTSATPRNRHKSQEMLGCLRNSDVYATGSGQLPSNYNNAANKVAHLA
jgi:hypothetical protein